MTEPNPARAAGQKQFLDVVDRDEAMRRFLAELSLTPVGAETVSLYEAHGRILADDVRSTCDVTAFDRANVDGFAVVAASTSGAAEETPVRLQLNAEVLTPGVEPQLPVAAGTATVIATGSIVPRGADAVVMVEHTETVPDEEVVEIRQAVAPGQSVSFAGTDIALGEVILHRGQVLSSREVGVLAAVGRDEVTVYRRPRVALLSTGNEIVPPGDPLRAGCVYDSNLAILSAAVVECGGEPVRIGVVRDELKALENAIEQAVACDAVVLSGGTSKGEGDLSYQVLSRFDDPGVVAHGVALKPGKPVCLAADAGKPLVVLPGFPTSAVFTFHEFVAPVVRKLAGRGRTEPAVFDARLATRVNSDRGRTEYLLVQLLRDAEGCVAYPMGKGSGSVTAFSMADGFITIDQHTEIVAAGARVRVQMLSESLAPVDLVVMGSDCRGVDLLVGAMRARGYTTKVMAVGSLAGLRAVERSACDLAGIHLLDPDSGEYNTAWLTDDVHLVGGYRRRQGIVFRNGDDRFTGKTPPESAAALVKDRDCVIVNRNRGSGTRILIDGLLGEHRPAGYSVEARSHNAVCAAIRQGRADWGVALDVVADAYDLDFVPLADEQFDFVIPRDRLDRKPVRAFVDLLADPQVREELKRAGFAPLPAP